MAIPSFVLEFDPAPAAIPRAAHGVRSQLRPAFISDLFAARYADDGAELIQARVQQRHTDEAGRQMKAYAPLTRAVRQHLGLGTNVDLTMTGRVLEAMKGGSVQARGAGGRFGSGREPAIIFEGFHPTGKSGVSVSNELLARWLHFGTSSRGVVVFRGGRLIGIKGKKAKPGIPARRFFGFTRADESFMTGTAAVLFQVRTLPRVLAEWERGL